MSLRVAPADNFAGATRQENNPVRLFLAKAVSELACEQGEAISLRLKFIA